MMTDDEIEALAKKHIAPHADRLANIRKDWPPYQQTEQFRRVKAFVRDVEAKLRAPVADERAAFIDWLTGSYPNAYSEPEAVRLWHHGHVSALAWKERGRRAALASAPVAVTHLTEDAPGIFRVCDEGIAGAFPVYRMSAPVAGEADDEEATDAWRRLALQFDGHRMQAIGWLKAALAELPETPAWSAARAFIAAPPLTASAPVAGEAQRLDAPAQVGGTRFGKGIHWSTVIHAAQRHHEYMQDPAREAARIAQAKQFQSLVAGDAAPQASEVLPTSTGGRDPIIHAVASLAAAISLLERTEYAKNAAASDKMFSQMLQDYRTALDNARAALASAPVADERAAFEAAYKRRQGTPINLELLRDGSGYTDGADGARNLNVAWETWQDARAALASAPVAGEASELLRALVDLHAVARVDRDEDYAAVSNAAEVIAKHAAPQASTVAGEAQPSDYVQTVPEHCDRILWRGQYYALPLCAAPQSIKPGYVLVPIEPTKEMLTAAFELFELAVPGYATGNDARRAIYKAMVGAAK